MNYQKLPYAYDGLVPTIDERTMHYTTKTSPMLILQI